MIEANPEASISRDVAQFFPVNQTETMLRSDSLVFNN